MRALVLFIVLAGVLSLFSAISGVRSIRGANPGVAITRHTLAGRAGNFAFAIACAAALYGIHKRARIAWTVGWFVLAAGWVQFLFSTLWWPGLAPREPLGLSIAGTLGVTALCIYFAFRWYQQRSYFTPQHDPKT